MGLRLVSGVDVPLPLEPVATTWEPDGFRSGSKDDELKQDRGLEVSLVDDAVLIEIR